MKNMDSYENEAAAEWPRFRMICTAALKNKLHSGKDDGFLP